MPWKLIESEDGEITDSELLGIQVALKNAVEKFDHTSVYYRVFKKIHIYAVKAILNLDE